jgi:hypothetical protein
MKEIQSSNVPLAVILSMLAGTFIVFGGLMLFAMLSWYGSTLMMGGQWHMYMFAYPRWLTAVVATISVLAGGLVMSASYKMYKEPRTKLWGLDNHRVSCEPIQHRRIWAGRYTWIGRWHNGA